MKKKFDSKTAVKIINQYAEKINILIKDNHNYKNQVDDLKITLSINKEMLYKYIGQQNKKDLISDMQKENTRLAEQNSFLHTEKCEIEKKLYKLQQSIEDKCAVDRDELDRCKELMFIFENKILEKENLVQHLKNELDKYYRNDDTSPKEILLGDPERLNVELYNELNCSRELLARLSRKLNLEKQARSTLEEKVHEYEEKIQNLKKGRKITKNMENIAFLGYITSDDDENEDEEESRNIFNLESPVVKFPEKIKMKSDYNPNNTISNLPMKNIPKLDLSEVKAKYHATKNVEIAEVFHKKSNRSNTDYIEKMRFQLKVCKNTIQSMKKKIEKYKRIFEVHRGHLAKLKNKNEFLEMQLKKSTGSTNDETGKKDLNTSMNANTSVRFDDSELDENEFDFDNLVRDYNRSVVNTTDYK